MSDIQLFRLHGTGTASEFAGKTLVIKHDKVTLAGETSKEPEFEHHFEDMVRYLREEAHAASGKLGLPITAEVIDLACAEVLRKSHGKLACTGRDSSLAQSNRARA